MSTRKLFEQAVRQTLTHRSAGKGKGEFQIMSIGESRGAGKVVEERAETLDAAKTRAKGLAKRKKVTVVVQEPGNGTPVVTYDSEGNAQKTASDEDTRNYVRYISVLETALKVNGEEVSDDLLREVTAFAQDLEDTAKRLKQQASITDSAALALKLIVSGSPKDIAKALGRAKGLLSRA